MKEITKLTDFEQEIQSDSTKLFVVDFNAPWCGPCKTMGNMIKGLTDEELAGAEIISVDVDEDDEISTKYGIRNIPTFLCFKDNLLVDRFTGNVGKDEFLKHIKDNNAK